MNKEKQIEMAKVIQKGELDRNKGVLDCTEFTTDIVVKVGLQRLAGAKALYNAGYRKASDVAREIFEEIDDLLTRYRIATYGGHFYSMDMNEEYAELKKKYTEEGK